MHLEENSGTCISKRILKFERELNNLKDNFVGQAPEDEAPPKTNNFSQSLSGQSVLLVLQTKLDFLLPASCFTP